MRFVPLLVIVLAGCSASSDNSPQAQCERQADQDPEVKAIVEQPWVDTYRLSIARRDVLQTCLRKKGVPQPGGVQPVYKP
jgi:hypothetical protein